MKKTEPPLPNPDAPLPEGLGTDPERIVEKMLLPCAVEFAGTTYGPGEVEIVSAGQRRALERAVENAGYELGEPIPHDPENPQVFSGEAQVGEAK